jgi:hypothetical protein
MATALRGYGQRCHSRLSFPGRMASLQPQVSTLLLSCPLFTCIKYSVLTVNCTPARVGNCRALYGISYSRMDAYSVAGGKLESLSILQQHLIMDASHIFVATSYLQVAAVVEVGRKYSSISRRETLCSASRIPACSSCIQHGLVDLPTSVSRQL